MISLTVGCCQESPEFDISLVYPADKRYSTGGNWEGGVESEPCYGLVH